MRAVRHFIESFGESRFEDLEPTVIGGSPVIQRRAGYRRGHGKDQVWMVLPEVWKLEVCVGLDPKLVAHALADRSMLVRERDGHQKVQWIDNRPIRTYTVTANILSGMDTADATSSNDDIFPSTRAAGVSGVSGVSKGFSEGGHTPQNHSDINNLTCLTPLTPQNDIEGVRKDVREDARSEYRNITDSPEDRRDPDYDRPTYKDLHMLAGEAQEWARATGSETAAMEDEIRRRLATFGVPPEEIEKELEKILQIIFKPIAITTYATAGI
jgi:hypothetical protein